MNEHPRSGTDERHVENVAGLGKTLVHKIQDHLDGLVWAAEQHGCNLRASVHAPQELPCRECYEYTLCMTEAAGCATALGILRGTDLDVEMDLSYERLGMR